MLTTHTNSESSKEVFQNINNRNLFLVEVVNLSQGRLECGEAHVSLKRRVSKDRTGNLFKADTIKWKAAEDGHPFCPTNDIFY